MGEGEENETDVHDAMPLYNAKALALLRMPQAARDHPHHCAETDKGSLFAFSAGAKI